MLRVISSLVPKLMVGVTHSSLLPRTGMDTIRTVIDTNLTGTILACRTVSKLMLKQQGTRSSDVN
jgi:NAD(P)-dependent dehydrogenase (short-subunit alcohol dehydrogenase family)